MNTVKVSDFEIALILAQQHAIINICSLIFTALLWLFLFLALLSLKLLGVFSFSPLAHIPQLLQVLSLIGLTPILIALLSFKFLRSFIGKYVKYYRDKHMKKGAST